jgi:hypothetical protein
MLSRGPCRPLDSLSMRNVAACGEFWQQQLQTRAGFLVSYRPLEQHSKKPHERDDAVEAAPSPLHKKYDTQSYS